VPAPPLRTRAASATIVAIRRRMNGLPSPSVKRRSAGQTRPLSLPLYPIQPGNRVPRPYSAEEPETGWHPYEIPRGRGTYHPAPMGSVASRPPSVDLWAPVDQEHLPASLRQAAADGDWNALRTELQAVMDAVTTDGVYGRALLQFVMSVGLPPDPVLERYRASICIDHGDWDGLQRHLASNPVEAAEIIGIRDIVLAPVDRRDPPTSRGRHQEILFEVYEWQFQRAVGRYRRWAQRMSSFYPEVIWRRSDIPAGRHFRLRRLQDVVWLAVSEAQGGRLTVANALAEEAQQLGDEGEPGRDVAHDLLLLVTYALGGKLDRDLRLLKRIASPVGLSPLGSWECIFHLIPFLALTPDESLDWSVRLGQQVASRFGSPRMQLQVHGWQVAAELIAGRGMFEAGLPGLLAESQRAAPGLKVLPFLLRAYSSREPEDFVAAEQIARHVGSVWAQVSALTWLVALNPRPTAVRWLHRLLETTGWRRPILVPPTVAADAALGLAAAGKRGISIVELALLGGRANVTVEVAIRHIDDAEAPSAARVAAVEALAKLGTTHSREILHRLSRRTDEISSVARRLLASRSPGTTLSEREVEVLDLARHGLTNREIAERLSLSPHTIARHLANARGKLGASNRTEAAAKLDELEVESFA
jgi:DNA-binding CsgD family transcriptional regulator